MAQGRSGRPLKSAPHPRAIRLSQEPFPLRRAGRRGGGAGYDRRMADLPSHAHDPLPFVDDYLPALLAQASELISGEFHAVVQAAGFSVPEWRILATLASKPGLSIGGLADITVSKQPTVTRLLDRMEAKGYVQRYPHDSDRRITMVRITPTGRAIVADLMAQAKEHEHRVLQPFGLKRAEALKVTLRRIIELHRGPA
jgi:DNA-binding MarR family transcriptional regulator